MLICAAPKYTMPLMLQSCATTQVALLTLYHVILGNCDSHCHLVSTRGQISTSRYLYVFHSPKRKTGPPHTDTPLTTNRHILLFFLFLFYNRVNSSSIYRLVSTPIPCANRPMPSPPPEAPSSEAIRKPTWSLARRMRNISLSTMGGGE